MSIEHCDHSVVLLLPALLVHLLDELELVVVLRPLLLELLLLLLPLLLLLVPHLLPAELLQLRLQPRVQLGDVQLLVPVHPAVHLRLVQRLVQRQLLLALRLHLHLLRVALSKHWVRLSSCGRASSARRSCRRCRASSRSP